jgi:hypothetical protein
LKDCDGSRLGGHTWETCSSIPSASYNYLGARRIVVEDYEEIEVDLDCTPNEIAGRDGFGQCVTWSRAGWPRVIAHPGLPQIRSVQVSRIRFLK